MDWIVLIKSLSPAQGLVVLGWAVITFGAVKAFYHYAKSPVEQSAQVQTVGNPGGEVKLTTSTGPSTNYIAGVSQLGKGLSIEYIRKAHSVNEATWIHFIEYLNSIEGGPHYAWNDVDRLKSQEIRVPFDGLAYGLYCYAIYSNIDSFGEFGISTKPLREMPSENKDYIFELHRIKDCGGFIIAYSRSPQQGEVNAAKNVLEIFVLNRIEPDTGFIHPVVIPIGRLASIGVGPDHFGFMIKLIPGVLEE